MDALFFKFWIFTGIIINHLREAHTGTELTVLFFWFFFVIDMSNWLFVKSNWMHLIVFRACITI